MAANAPTRIDADLFAAAKTTGAASSRSAAQQVNHWARIGRQLEASGCVSQRDVARVLAGTYSYDSLDAFGQAAVRAEWDERMTATRESLDFTSRLAEAALPWAEADEAGETVRRQPGDSAPAKPGRSPKASTRRRTPRPAA